MKRNRQIKNKIENFLEFPKEIVSEAPRITIVEFNHMIVENFKAIIEYDENYIRLSTTMGNIIIEGLHLNLNQMTSDDMEVTGKIIHLELEEIS